MEFKVSRKIKGLTKQESEAISKFKQELLSQIGSDVEIILFDSKARACYEL